MGGKGRQALDRDRSQSSGALFLAALYTTFLAQSVV